MYLSTNECYLCRTLNPETRDHVVPKCLLAAPKPPNVLTLPCCKKCQKKYQKDEEYFRDAMAAMCGHASNDPVKEIWKKAKRSLDRRPARKAEFIQRMSPVDVVSAGGIFLRKGLALSSSESRLGAVLEKIARGLHSHVVGVSPKPEWVRTIYALERPEHLPEELLQMPLQLHYTGIFACRGAPVEGNLASLWLMQFYDSKVFWVELHDESFSFDS